MDSEYPPLPPSGIIPAPIKGPSTFTGPKNGESPDQYISDSQEVGMVQPTKVISRNGDVIIDYHDRASGSDSPGTSHHWQVASEDLMLNSPYFRVLLDPNKFSEGRNLMEQKMSRLQVSAQETTFSSGEDIANMLPRVSLPADHLTRRLGVDALELFLRILSVNSLTDDERSGFESEIRSQPTSLIVRLVEISDIFNSPDIVRQMLKQSEYSFGKGRIVLSRFHPSLLRISEDRIRQIIFIADFLNEHSVFQVLTHTLIIVGSKFWVNGLEQPASDSLRWRYLPGLEEELYYRRQCVLNTITDLQAFFLRAYGAMEELDTKQTSTTPGSATTIRPRQFQCRWGSENSSVCDAFHLGQMTRFFTMRTKTVFLGSSLIDPDFNLDEDDDANDNMNTPERALSEPPSDITSIIASLKQFPDYQIDTGHTGCGVRRRLVPALDCIEKFVGDGRGLLGVFLRHGSPLSSISWTNRALPTAKTVDIRSSSINTIHYTNQSLRRSANSQEDQARLLFTARSRNWEA